MGGSNSKRTETNEVLAPGRSGPAHPPFPSFSEPWREINWGDKEEDLDYLRNYKPKDGIKHLRILLYGPVGAGKSSFINSVSSVIRGRTVIRAAASAAKSELSFTNTYKTHTIKQSDETVHPIVLNDVMGLEDGDKRGAHPDDIKLAMMGHVKEGYKFHTTSVLSEQCSDYNKSPSADDKCHVLVCVISANMPEIKASVLQKMKTIREAARDRDIPQVCIMTHIDAACGKTESDVKNVYKSKYLKTKMQTISTTAGFPMNCIYPVKNYSEEKDLSNDVDALILSALRFIVEVGDDYINEMQI